MKKVILITLGFLFGHMQEVAGQDLERIMWEKSLAGRDRLGRYGIF